MKKYKKIILSIVICIVTLFIFSINAFALENSTYNSYAESMYLFRYQNYEQQLNKYYAYKIYSGSDITTYNSNWTLNVSGYNNGGSLHTDKSFYNYTKLDTYYANIDNSFDNYSKTNFVRMLIQDYTDYTIAADMQKSNIYTENDFVKQNYIGDLFFAGYYAMTSFEIVGQNSDLSQYQQYYRNGTIKIEKTINEIWTEFIDSLYQCYLWSYNQSNINNLGVNIPINIMWSYNEELCTLFNYSIYNVLYYEMKDQITWQYYLDHTNYNVYNTSLDDENKYIEVYLRYTNEQLEPIYVEQNQGHALNDNYLINKMTKIPYYSKVYKQTTYNIDAQLLLYKSKDYFLNSGVFDWLPLSLKNILMPVVLSIITLSVTLAIAKFIGKLA